MVQVSKLTIHYWEGGIKSHSRVIDAPALRQSLLDSLPCTCNGEAHDECAPEEEE